MSAVACGLGALALSCHAQAQAMHWGGDTRPISADECLSRAAQSLNARGYSVSNDTRIVTGERRHVMVLVSCTALASGTDIFVVASSGDSALAERARNEVRGDVMGPQ